MSKSIIFKGIGGFYYVMHNNVMYECKARGKFKNQQITPLVGDYVRISILDEEKALGMIEEIHDRKSVLLRPNVSNVDQAIIVFSIKNPSPNEILLDKMLVLAENAGLEIVLCFNKGDLDEESKFETFEKKYEKTGYKLIKTCANTGEGVDELIDTLKDKISVFSGPSGVGKSSLLNAIEEGFSLQVGELSLKIKRGKHTTRHSELFKLKSGGIVVDTPGFTSLSMHEVESDDLKSYFPEFQEPSNDCRFDNCLHINEPQCAVKKAVGEKVLSKERYEAYAYIYNEMLSQKGKGKKW